MSRLRQVGFLVGLGVVSGGIYEWCVIHAGLCKYYYNREPCFDVGALGCMCELTSVVCEDGRRTLVGAEKRATGLSMLQIAYRF
jgi:hypothetical protein